jgi:hypothetical protein
MQIVQATTTPQFYELDWSVDHLIGDLTHDIWLKNSSEWQDISNVLGNRRNLILQKPIEYESIEEYLVKTDYPYNSNSFPIMSKQMLDVLRSVRDFSHQAIPIVIIDTEVKYNEEIKKYAKSGAKNYNFSLVRIPEHLDVFDWKNSTYELNPKQPERVKPFTGDKIVLKEPEEGFPPLFRVSAMPHGLLLVSAEAKAALEAAGIRGVKFIDPKFLKY